MQFFVILNLTVTSVGAGAAMAGRQDMQVKTSRIWLKRRRTGIMFTSMG
jgi:hypothetical protein